MRYVIENQFQEVSRITKHSLSLLHEKINVINLKSFQHYVSLLDRQAKAKFSKQIELMLSKIETKFGKPKEYLPDNIKGFTNTVSPALEALVTQGRGNIWWEQVIKLKEEVSAKIEEIIISIFDDRVKLATKVIAQAIAFYNDFLERQERYQQETPEQRMAEKTWIAQQWRELARVQNGIEAILNQSAG